MKVTVTKNLNVRVGRPSVNATCYQYLASGSELEVKDEIFKGDKYDGDDRWLKDGAGNYYWVGGTNYDELMLMEESDSIGVMNFDFPWLQTLSSNMGGLPEGDGKGLTVAILDSGITNSTLERMVVYSKDFIEEIDHVEGKNIARDFNGHGTSMASIIHALAPRAKLINLRVSDQNGIIKQQAVDEALDCLMNLTDDLKPDVVNMSFDINNRYESSIHSKIKELTSQCLFVGAAGNSGQILESFIFKPARFKEVVSVGTVKLNDVSKLAFSNIARKADILFFNEKIRTASNKGGMKEIGYTSTYTAIISGLLSRSALNSSDRSSHIEQLKQSLDTTNPKTLTPYNY